MSIELIFTLYVDADGNERFTIQHPTDDDLIDVTDQFEIVTSETEDGDQAVTFIKKKT